WRELLGVERVGRHDNFFELGGHSLLAVTLVERMRQAGLHSDIRQLFGAADLAALAASLSGDAALVAAPANGIPAAGCEAITPEMVTLTALSQAQIDAIAAQVPGGMANIQDIYPLAPLQEGILFHHLLGGEGDAYLLYDLLAFDSRERLNGFLASLQQAVDRHDILRTAVLWQDLPEPVQVVWRQAPVQVETVALDPADGPLAQQLEARYHPRRHRIDVRQAPLLRGFAAAEAATGRHYLQLLFHHLAIDHTALETMLQEISLLQQGRQAELGPMTPFRQFVAQARLGVSAAEHEAYFRAQLGEVDEPTLPFGLQGYLGDGGDIEEARLNLSTELAGQLRQQARRLGVSVACLAHLAWGQVLARASGRTQVVFGTVLFGRLQGGAGADRALGLFINTLPLKLEIGAATAREAVKQTQQALTSLLRHEHASLALAQRCSGVAAPQPLFSALLNYRHSVEDDVAALDWEGIETLASEERTNYPLTLSVDDLGVGLALTAQTLASVGAARVCAMMETALASLAAALASDSGEAVRSLDVLPAAERRQLLETFNDTAADYPRGELIHRLFEAQAAARPEAVALVCGEQTLSYGELNRRANQLAHRLIGLGVVPEARVGICLERGLDMVVGLLGILKAGGAYVPLDPSYPAERLSYMLEDSAPAMVLTHSGLAAKAAGAAPRLLLDDADEQARLSALSGENPSVAGLGGDNAAYVIYTSGSTGRPKGVVSLHAGVCHVASQQADIAGFGTGSRVLQFASFSFDASVWEWVSALIHGACLYLYPREELMPGEPLLQTLNRDRISHALLPASALQMMEANAVVQRMSLLVGGEACPVGLAESWAAQHRLQNVYGPTETTIFVTAQPCATNMNGRLPIGKPIANTYARILDTHGQLAPLGVAGEIHIGGVGVARGYLNRPELTAERFIADPYSADPQARLYKTGDLGRWLPDGSIEYLGRNDFQVKIRGFRIELGEIEAKLAACAGVKEAVVLAREDAPGDKRLVAYLTAQPGAELEPSSLRAALSQELAEYMVPSGFVVLEAFPLTPNGKLDRKALPAPDGSQLSSRAYAAPEGEAETTLAAIWRELLGVERVGRHDNFFELGGHSLLAVRLVASIAGRMPYAASLQDVYAFPSLAELARRLSAGGGNDAAIRVGGQGEEERLFILHELHGGIAYARYLAEHLGQGRSIYALPGIDEHGNLLAEPDMGGLARMHAARIRSLQAKGPYSLAGWSVGGTIAHAVAAELSAQGEEIAFLGLIDSMPDYSSLAARLEQRQQAEQNERVAMLFLWLELEHGYDEAGLASLRRLPNPDEMLSTALKEVGRPAAGTLTEEWSHLTTRWMTLKAALSYQPKRLAAPTVLFVATDSLAANLDQGWRQSCPDLTVETIKGDHYSILQMPAIRVLGEAFRKRLAEEA
ncbi:amino acid adenylation domain-containing protein, partial [Chromobacterium violaceum]